MLPARSKFRVELWELSEDTGLLLPRQGDTAWGWLHRAAITPGSSQWRDYRLPALSAHITWWALLLNLYFFFFLPYIHFRIYVSLLPWNFLHMWVVAAGKNKNNSYINFPNAIIIDKKKKKVSPICSTTSFIDPSVVLCTIPIRTRLTRLMRYLKTC